MPEDTGRKVRALEQRVEELERIVNQELGYSIGQQPMEPQECECICGETFEINVRNGLICPECGAGSEERAQEEG